MDIQLASVAMASYGIGTFEGVVRLFVYRVLWLASTLAAVLATCPVLSGPASSDRCSGHVVASTSGGYVGSGCTECCIKYLNLTPGHTNHCVKKRRHYILIVLRSPVVCPQKIQEDVARFDASEEVELKTDLLRYRW